MIKNKEYNKKLEAELIEQFSDYDLWSLEGLENKLKNVINKAKERRLEKINNVHFDYEWVDGFVRMEDLLLEDTFPCDIKYTGWHCNKISGMFFCIIPVIIPTDAKVMHMMFNRYLSKEERDDNVYEISRIMMWYVDNAIDMEQMDEDDTDLPRRLCLLLTKVMDNWAEPLYWNLYEAEVGKFPKELWVGFNEKNGKLTYSSCEKPKFIPLWKNIKVTYKE